MRDDFAILILTHGCAGKVRTVRTLQREHYSGKWYMVLDDEDEQKNEYIKEYGKDKIIVFNKQQVVDRTDTMDNFNNHLAIIYARNESWNIAKQLGLKYFLMLDDDYTAFSYRKADRRHLRAIQVKNIDKVFNGMIDFLEASGASTVAFAQAGDCLGGVRGINWKRKILRKAMNSFFCKTDCPIEYKGTMNEDVTTYTTQGSQGKLFLTVMLIALVQSQTQSLEGGMQSTYADGTYAKSMYAVMSMPSSVKVSVMGEYHKRIHHSVNWEHTVPKIINEKWQKKESVENE